MTKNRSALAMRQGLTGDYRNAMEMFDAKEEIGNLGLPTRAHSVQEIADWLFDAKCQLINWYGVRVFTDHIGELPASCEGLADVLKAEVKASQTEPYKLVGRLLHTVARKGVDMSSLEGL